MASTLLNRDTIRRVLGWLLAWLASTAVAFELLLLLCSVRITIEATVHPQSSPTVVMAQIYWADGQGQFEERRSRSFRLESERNTYSVDVPADSDAVRIDPLEQPGSFEITSVRVTGWRLILQDGGGSGAFGRWEPADIADVDIASGVFRGRAISLDPHIVVHGLRPIFLWHWLTLAAPLAAAVTGCAWLFLRYRVSNGHRTVRETAIRPRRVVLALMAVVTSLLLVETFSAVGLWMIRKWPATSFEEQYRAHLNARQTSFRIGSNQIGPHPYFGFRFDPDAEATNNFGFKFAPDFPYRRKPNDFVIGVFGGSMAQWFAYHADRLGLLAGLSQRIPELRNRDIKVVTFALPASKQPQQFIIASYFVRDCDLLINVDGFNDGLYVDPRSPPEFPWSYPELYETSGWERALPRLTNRLVDGIAQLAVSQGLAKRSAFFYAAWHLAIASAHHAVGNLADRLQRRMADRRLDQTNGPAGEDETAGASAWAHYTALEDAVVRTMGRRALFFLQPNQYVKPAKPFTPEERLGALSDASLAASMERRYHALRTRLHELRANNVLVFDLTDAFAQEGRTIYIDPCCHINLLGNQILAERIVASIVEQRAAIFPAAASAR